MPSAFIESQEEEKSLIVDHLRLQAIMDNSFQLIGLLTTDGVLIEVNKTALKLINIDLSEVVGKLFWDAPWWSHDPKMQEICKKSVLKAAKGEKVRAEATHYDDQGSLHYIDFSIMPVFDRQGKVIYLIPEGRDITDRKIMEEDLRRHQEKLEELVAERTRVLMRTNEELRREIEERKKTEKALKDSEERLRAIFNYTSAVMYVKDLKNRYIGVNRQFSKIFKISEEEIKGKSEYELHPYEAARVFVENDQEVLRRGEPLQFEENIHQDDGVHNYLSIKFPLYNTDGEMYALCGISTDITERKQIEDALRESERRYRELFNNISDFVYSHDLEGRILDINPAAAESLGYNAAELRGRLIIEFMPEEIKESFTSDYMLRLHNEMHDQGVLTFLAKDGSEHYIEYRSNMVKHHTREPYVSGSGRDVTDRVTASRERTKLEDRLRQSQKMEAIGTLAGGIAHDFNNILGAMIGYAEMAKLKTSQESPVQRYFDQILKAGGRATELVKHILSFSRQTETERKPLDIGVIVKESLKLLRATLPSTIEINSDIPDNIPTLLADPTHIHQIILNLCTNAAQAMGENRGLMSIKIESIKVEPIDSNNFQTLEPGDYIKLSISDTGPGIPSEIRDRIFDPYFTTKQIGEGTGLGLSTVHGIVETYKGSIDLYSESGQGAVFNIYLPAVAEQSLPESGTAPVYTGGSETILLVDDEETLVHIESEILKNLGYRVESHYSSLSALESFKKDPEKFDIVITDQTMPQMTGIELAAAIKAISPQTPIILCTGYSTTITDERLKAAGISEIIMKPVLASQFSETIRKALDWK